MISHAYKRLIYKIDSILLSIKEHLPRLLKRGFMHRSGEFTHGYICQYMKNDNSEINKLCDKYGTDKGESTSEGHPYPWPSHNYADVYESMFRLRKRDVELVIECGIGTNNPKLASSMCSNRKPGASLRMWRDYFPNARIIGVDIDEEILFSEERISTYKCDQTSKESIEKFATNAALIESSVDIIIDDGLHTFSAGKAFFEGMIKYLSDQGVYVIEDVSSSSMIRYKDYFLALANPYSVELFYLSTPKRQNTWGNRLVVVRKNV